MSAPHIAAAKLLDRVAEEGLTILKNKAGKSLDYEDDVVRGLIHYHDYDLSAVSKRIDPDNAQDLDLVLDQKLYKEKASLFKRAESNYNKNNNILHLQTNDEIELALNKHATANYEQEWKYSDTNKVSFNPKDQEFLDFKSLKEADETLTDEQAYNLASYGLKTKSDYAQSENLENWKNTPNQTISSNYQMRYYFQDVNNNSETVFLESNHYINRNNQNFNEVEFKNTAFRSRVESDYPNWHSKSSNYVKPSDDNVTVSSLETGTVKNPESGPQVPQINQSLASPQQQIQPNVQFSPSPAPVVTQQSIVQPTPVAPHPVTQPATVVNQAATQQAKAAEPPKHPFYTTVIDDQFDSAGYQQQYYKDVKAGTYEQKVSDEYLGYYQDKELFNIEVNPSNFNTTSKEGNVNQFGETLQKVVERHATMAGSQDAPAINKLLSNPILEDESFTAFTTQYATNKRAGLNPIAAASHNIGRMKEKSQSVLGNMLEQESGSTSALYKMAATGAVGAGIGYAMYDNPTEGAMMGVMGGAVGAGAMKALALNSEGIQNSMMKSLLKDKFKPGASSDALNENFEAVTKLNKEDLGFVDNYYKDTLTKNFGTASMGLQSRTMIMSGAALAGVAFTGNKKDKRRGFNANRGNRI